MCALLTDLRLLHAVVKDSPAAQQHVAAMIFFASANGFTGRDQALHDELTKVFEIIRLEPECGLGAIKALDMLTKAALNRYS